MQKVKLNLNQIMADFENGLTRPELAEKWGLTIGALNKALKEKGLKGVRAKQKSWVWEDDVEETLVEATPVVEDTVPTEEHDFYMETRGVSETMDTRFSEINN
jgi:hypothetical protein